MLICEIQTAKRPISQHEDQLILSSSRTWFEWESPYKLIYILMSGSQLMECLERVRKCGFVGTGVPLGVGFEVSKACAKTSVSVCLSVPISWPTACGSYISSQLLLQHCAYLLPCSLPRWPQTHLLELEASPGNDFFYKKSAQQKSNQDAWLHFVWPTVRYLISLNFSVLLCEIQTAKGPVSQI